MKLAKWLSLALVAVAVALVATLAATRALAPLPGPDPSSATEPFSSNLLSGTVIGLDPGDSAHLLVEQLAEGQAEGHGGIVQRFNVIFGDWQQPGLALPSGYYRLVPEAEGYVHIPHSIFFQVLEESIVWRYTDLNFEFLHPADALARLGLPLCPDPSSPVVPVTAVPEDKPGPTPVPESMRPGPPAQSPGMCYANHLADVRLVPAGLQGSISGLAEGQMATVTLYALPPVPGESYGQGEPPSPDSSWVYPPEVARLTGTPEVAPDWLLTAVLVVGNGPWGLVDPSLVGGKYLVLADADGQTGQPPAYEVVIFSGKAPGFPGGVDFAFGPEPQRTQRYLDSLGAVKTSHVCGDQLWLETEDGQALVLSTPLPVDGLTPSAELAVTEAENTPAKPLPGRLNFSPASNVSIQERDFTDPSEGGVRI